jgi:putative endopeptidase
MHRANGPVVNIDAWYQAFNVQPGDKMYKAPEQRIRIW